MRILCLLFVAVTALPVTAASVFDLPEVRAYRNAVERLNRNPPGATVEQAFTAGLALRKALLAPAGPAGSLLEALPQSDFEKLGVLLPGMSLNREEVVFAEPDSEFFLKAAELHGRPVDVAFVLNYRATFPDGVWPSYTQRQTDSTGCDDYGTGELTRRYKGWTRFRARYPNAYKEAVSERIEQMDIALTAGTCACGTRESVEKEFALFVRELPHAAPAAKVRNRLRELRQGKSKIRFKCISG